MLPMTYAINIHLFYAENTVIESVSNKVTRSLGCGKSQIIDGKLTLADLMIKISPYCACTTHQRLTDYRGLLLKATTIITKLSALYKIIRAVTVTVAVTSL